MPNEKLVKSKRLVGSRKKPRTRKPKSREPSKFGVHKRKIDDKLFKSFGIGGFFLKKEDADKAAKEERDYGSETRVVPVEGGHRLFLRPTAKTTKQSDVHAHEFAVKTGSGTWHLKSRKPTRLTRLEKDGYVLDYYCGDLKFTDKRGKEVYKPVEIYLVKSKKNDPTYQYRIEKYGFAGTFSTRTQHYPNRSFELAKNDFDWQCKIVHGDTTRVDRARRK